jgi:hypothetical protein
MDLNESDHFVFATQDGCIHKYESAEVVESRNLELEEPISMIRWHCSGYLVLVVTMRNKLFIFDQWLNIYNVNDGRHALPYLQV